MPNKVQYVRQHIANCEVCNMATPTISHPPLTPLVSKRNMQILEVDYFGPIHSDPETGHRYYYKKNFFHLYLFLYFPHKICNCDD